MSQVDWNRNREQLTIKSVQITSENKLNVTVTNTGSVYSRLLWLGLFNQSVTPEAQWFFNLNKQIEPAATTNILTDFIVTEGKKYVVQIATEAGNIFNSNFYPASEVTCALTLVAASTTVYQGNDITLFLTVTNNDTKVDIIQNITVSLQVAPLGLVTVTEQPSTLTIKSLRTGETAFFKWIYQATNTGTVTFNMTYDKAPVGVFALSTVTIATTPAGGAQGQVAITGQNGSATFNPSQWTTLGGTQNVSGTLANLVSSDSNPVVFNSYYTGTSTDTNYFVGSSTSNVDGSPSKGTHSSFAAQQAGPDSIYDTLTEAGSASTNTYNPSSYGLLGSTQLVSGTLADLQTNNNVYMTFQSYPSAFAAQQLYAHSETSTIGGLPYYLQKLTSADGTATTLSASMGTTGRQLLGKFVYPLTGVTVIPASTWTMNYRTWRDTGGNIGFDAVSNADSGSSYVSSLSWSHTTGSGSNRLLIVGVTLHPSSPFFPASVSSVTYGSQSLTQIRTDTGGGNTIRSDLWYLVAPASGTNTITVTLSFFTSAKIVAGACTYTGVDQTSPLDVATGAGGSGSSSSPSQSITVNTNGCWIVGNLAALGDNSAVSEGSGQNTRWDGTATGGGQSSRCTGHGSDKGPVNAGSQSMSWSLPSSTTWAVSIVSLKSAPPAAGSADVNILIRQSDGTIRTTIATGVASSPTLSSTASTLQGTYSWANYTVVSQTDYLEIDYYVNVASAVSGTNTYLRIDDNTLAITNQTRATNVMLPSEYTVGVEFFGTSDTQTWNQLVWAIDSSFTASGVTATFQLYNYTAGAYSTSGDGYLTDTIGTTDITKTQTITANPNQFKAGSGNWRLKVTGVKTTTSQFNWKGDLVAYTPSSVNYELDLEAQWTSVDFSQTNEWLCIYGGTMAAENIRVDVWTGSAWQNVFTNLASGWNNVSISTYLTSSTFTIRFNGGTETNDPIQSSWNIDVSLLHLWTIADQYTAAVEFTGSPTQNWTSFTWSIRSSWSTAQAAVTIQFYNFTAAAYVTSGNGYLTYTSSATPNTYELKTQNVAADMKDFTNSSGNWKVKITTVKTTASQFLMNVDLIAANATYLSSGASVPYGAWQWYTIKATSAGGAPIPYSYVSIYANGTTLIFKNAVTNTTITNPAWVPLDVAGEYQLYLQSTSSSSENFVLYASVGTTIGQKNITQGAP